MSQAGTQWRFHAERDLLLAESHARPSTPVQAPLLVSMDRRAQREPPILETVKGLSPAAISDDALARLKGVIQGAAEPRRPGWPKVNPTRATGITAPAAVFLVWLFLRRIRASVAGDHHAANALRQIAR